VATVTEALRLVWKPPPRNNGMNAEPPVALYSSGESTAAARLCKTLSGSDNLHSARGLPVEFSFIDFLIGFLLMNAMAHVLFGLLKIRFLSIFGFSALANIAYGFFSVVVAIALFHYRYGIQEFVNHGIVIGSLTMLLIYLFSGKFFVTLFRQPANGHSD